MDASKIKIKRDHVNVKGHRYPFWIAAKFGWIEEPKAIGEYSRPGHKIPILIAEECGFVTSEYVGDCIRKEMQEKKRGGYFRFCIIVKYICKKIKAALN